MKKIVLSIISLIFLVFYVHAQPKLQHKELCAQRCSEKIVIDGNLNDAAWKKATVFDNLVEWRPTFGKVEDEKNRTEVYLLYNDDAIYVGGFCHEASNDSISKELVGRDVVGINDFVGIMFDTYNDKINGFGYYVTPLGEQFDAKYSNDGEDGSWSTVYETKSKIVAGGWTFEMRIPYSAIRFANKPTQTWGVNITRRRSKCGKQLMWNPVDPNLGGTFMAQFGLLNSINNIKPPVRLSLSPYISLYGNSSPEQGTNKQITSSNIGGGMDIKYGINQAFTLDATLVPDFSQVQSDNKVLNLTPFEVQYNENRPFFTEGTELFKKGNLFYSRRIGEVSSNGHNKINDALGANETATKDPSDSKLINAVKISGRMSKGLGIGFFNAITSAQYATVQDTIKGGSRQVETDPLTNFNIFVLDQTLKNNSSVSLINTNVLRSGPDYDANVTAGLWDLYDKKNKFNLGGKMAISNIIEKSTTTGYSHSLYFGKVGGRWNFNLWQELQNDKYNQNDMGYQTNNNYLDHGLWMGYKWTKPTKLFNRFYLNFNLNYSQRFLPRSYQSVNINVNGNGQLKNLWFVGGNINFNPQQHDFYEPRTDGYVFKRPKNVGAGFWINSNSSKKYSAGFNYYLGASYKFNSLNHEISLSNQYRFNNKLTIYANTNLYLAHNNLGYATTENNNVIFGLRDRTTVENVLNIKYNFNNVMGLSLNARHYWSKVNYNRYFQLSPDGDLSYINAISSNPNDNYNSFNIDMVYSWQFALGSFIKISWKNAIAAENQNVETPYFKNLGNTLSTPQSNSISIRVVYFLDYLSIKKKSK